MDNRIIDDPLAAFNAAMARKDAARDRERERDAYRSDSTNPETLNHTLIHTRSWTESVISMSIKIAHEQIDHHLQCDPYGQLVGLD